ncbi:iron-siderophore ABC transporter substrate-binding protein [Streptomyces chumphonensis]|uniref:ABC transporter substrate-binding protein n=1 Tax=Streptomyces chumphonensis TaxID=1214925 RepID=A0A927IDP4_9ACTN|nr:ABC transporter substrate-binding protein [Streptomyces chumphonensis]MBD3933120.1 ABC transporter substrate-binding protein [Streptomyces chumphonensis]
MRTRYACATAALAVPLLLTGCGSADTKDDTGDAKKAPAKETSREVTHELGSTEVPADPEAVIALDEVAGLTLVSLGITPDAVYMASAQPRAQEILREEGVELREVSVGTTPPLEQLAKAKPDLLVGTGSAGPTGTNYDKLTDLAPTIVLPIEGEWREIVTKTAAFFGEEERGKRQIVATEAVLNDAAEAVSGERTLSLLGNSFGENDFTMPPHVPISTLIKEAGFTRPAFQQKEVDGYSVPLSAEFLPEQDADMVIVPEGEYYDADAMREKPTFAELTGEVLTPDADVWFGMSGFAFYASAYDLRTLATDEGEISSADNIGDIWASFLEETEKQ